jgi:hypothetical protein
VWQNGQALTMIEGLNLALAALLAGCLLGLVISHFRWDSTGLGAAGWVFMTPLALLSGVVALGLGAFVKYVALTHSIPGLPALPALTPFWILPILAGLAGLLVVVDWFARQ